MWRTGLTLLIVTVWTLAAPAEVFTLWPYRGGSGSRPRVEMPWDLSEKPILTEPLEVNGLPLILHISSIGGTFEELATLLRKHFDSSELEFAKGTIRIAYRLPDGQIDRWLLIASGGGKEHTLFRITAPEKLPPPGDWPHELAPLPPGAKVRQIIRFSKRNAVYGTYTGASDDPVLRHRAAASQLRTLGWQPIGNEDVPAIGGNGDLFLNPVTRALLWVSAGKEGRGSSYCKMPK